MNYAMCYGQNFPFGSGVIEAIFKTLASQRLKCSRMRWRYEGSQTILTFRALNHSDLVDQARKIVADKYQNFVNAANDDDTLPLFDVA